MAKVTSALAAQAAVAKSLTKGRNKPKGEPQVKDDALITTAAPAAPEVAPAAPEVAKPVALRGGLVVTAVKQGPKVYRVKAAHNVAWQEKITKLLLDNGGTATVKQITEAGIPATHVGYMVRRGYLASV